ncbi:hypothetical protein J6590_040923 [Homalodisca vitripennis]|nr:hypothetical protein J6590_040923 [Homalodisca vitripennis]
MAEEQEPREPPAKLKKKDIVALKKLNDTQLTDSFLLQSALQSILNKIKRRYAHPSVLEKTFWIFFQMFDEMVVLSINPSSPVNTFAAARAANDVPDMRQNSNLRFPLNWRSVKHPQSPRCRSPPRAVRTVKQIKNKLEKFPIIPARSQHVTSETNKQCIVRIGTVRTVPRSFGEGHGTVRTVARSERVNWMNSPSHIATHSRRLYRDHPRRSGDARVPLDTRRSTLTARIVPGALMGWPRLRTIWCTQSRKLTRKLKLFTVNGVCVICPIGGKQILSDQACQLKNIAMRILIRPRILTRLYPTDPWIVQETVYTPIRPSRDVI